MIAKGRVLRSPAVLLPAFIAIVAVVGSLLVRSAVADEQVSIHRNQAGKVTTILQNSMTAIGDVLTLLGHTYQAGEEVGGEPFLAAASSRIKNNVAALLAVTENDGEFIVAVAVGAGLPSGSTLDSDFAALARRAQDEGELVTSIVTSPDPAVVWFVTAVGEATGPLMFQINIIQPHTPIAVAPNSPFSDLSLTVFTSTTEAAETLLLITSPDSPTGTSLRTEFVIGAETWMLVSRPNGALVSGFTESVWLIVLIGGLICAVATAAILRLTVRRRMYSERLIEQRTADLRTSLQQLALAKSTADAANTSKNEFLSRMSHELRTPLNGVLGFAQVLELSDLDAEQKDSVHQILKAGHHLLALINEVLDIVRIEAGEISISLEPVLLREVIEEMIDLQRSAANAASVSFDVVMHCTCEHYVTADRQRLKQIVLNLTSNAIKYNRIGGTITCACECDGHQVLLRVSDTGRGIPDEKRALLFIPFERLGAEHTTIEGTGIGLALSHNLALAMGGDLQLERSGDEGSTFALRLDLAEGQTDRYERLHTAGTEEAAKVNKTSILYVEDNLSNIKLVKRILQQRPGIALTPVMQGRLAVELAQSMQPSGILLDLHLPDVSGDEVLVTLRKNPATSHIPVIIISADATDGQIRRLTNAGACDYLTKPIDIERFLEAIDRITRNSMVGGRSASG